MELCIALVKLSSNGACLAMNFYISFGGTVTFKNAKLPKIAAQAIPIDRLLIETDAPYLAPTPNRRKEMNPDTSS